MKNQPDFKGRAKEPKRILTNGVSNNGQGMNQSTSVVNYDGGGSMRDAPGYDLDNAGFQVSGYITKKGLDIGGHGSDVRLNFLPPGMFIDTQKNADIRPITVKQVTGMGYPGDGWEGPSDDLGI